MIIYQYSCPNCGKSKLFDTKEPRAIMQWCPYCEKTAHFNQWRYAGMSERVSGRI